MMPDMTLGDMPDQLAAPFADGPAAGADPRADVTPQSLYFRLRDARSDARAAERTADNDPSAQDSGTGHWKRVRDLATQILGGQGKDLEVAAWLTEALVRSDGLAGLVAGTALLRRLVARYWSDGLFPLPDEEGPEARLAPLGGLSGAGGSDGTLLQPLRKLVLFEQPDGTPITFWEFEQMRARAATPAAKPPRGAAGLPPLDELERLARGSGQAALRQVAGMARAALAGWLALEQDLGAVVAAEALPSLRRLRELLENLRALAETYAPPIASDDLAVADPDTPAATAPERTEAAMPAPGFDRNAMLEDVLRIARRFRTAEPNSPFSYTLEEAVRRARLSWPELLQEMMPEPAARGAVLAGLGIRVEAK
ncbi:Type VI secretion system protein TssA [Rhodovastum atsumiense]|uniref:Type VI secretion system protein TssA n=1 Tax=Rhodovastum atsumiense TaxID=504468 RepID=A0A5M6IWM2_9PROT|nr:type VI secretion system protein TssA [Rhodovastum atsumiense]KAA5612726.1 type VI secretion system protein TssA [Rhodovastum atsumiense]CAH2602718.1 Type VI secretion system protein TssA [Rhodovastum atsumiense]